MNSANVFQAALIGFMQDGMPADVAHFEALVVLRGYLAASPSPSAATNSAKLHEYMKGLLSGDQKEKTALILDDTEAESITQIPRPECMRQRLPKGRKPTVEEVRKAWSECNGK